MIQFKLIENLRTELSSKNKKSNLFLKEASINTNQDFLLNDILNSKIIIYTAISGDYEVLNDPEFIDDNCDYVCFTDNPNLTSTVWKVVLMEDSNLDNNRRAKKYKVLPHKYFPNYKYSFWIDASLTIKGSIREYLQSYVCNEMLCVVNNETKDIYEEYKISNFQSRYPKYILKKQINNYKSKGFPKNYGIALTGVLFRQHNNPLIIKIMEEWWDEIIKYSTLCQLSFPYVTWKNDFHPTGSDIYVYANDFWGTAKKGNIHAKNTKSFLSTSNLSRNIKLKDKNCFNYEELYLILNDLEILENVKIEDIDFSFYEAFKIKIKEIVFTLFCGIYIILLKY